MEIVATCIRLCILFTGCFIFEFSFLDFMMIRKRSYTLLITVFVFSFFLKQIFAVYLLPLFGIEDASISILFLLVFLLYTTLVYFSLWYTYEGSFLKVTLISIIADINYSIYVPLILTLLNFLEEKNNLMEYISPVALPDLLCIPICYALIKLETTFLKPLQKMIRKYEPRHRKLFYAIALLYFFSAIPGTMSGFSDINIMEPYRVFPILSVCVIGTIVFLFLTMQYYNRTKKTYRFVKTQKDLVTSYCDSLQQQILKMNQNQKIMDAQMKQITSIIEQAHGITNIHQDPLVQEYLKTLQKKYKETKSIFYCKDWLVDSVLYNAERLCRQQQIKVSFLFEQYQRGKIPEQTISEIIYELLNYSIKEYSIHQTKKKTLADVYDFSLKTSALKNLFLLELHFTFKKISKKMEKELKHRLYPFILPYNGQLEAISDQKFLLCLQQPND